MNSPAALTAALKDAGRGLGFDLIGVARPTTPTGFPRLQAWLSQGYAGEMNYLPRRESAYEHPEHVLPGVRSLVMVAVNYHSDRCPPQPAEGPVGVPQVPARVAQYAWGGQDYHDILKERLQRLADRLHELVPGCRTRCVVDTAPLLERDFARLAGLGWFGKNTMLLNKRLGSFLFLGALLTDAELEADQPHEASHCGTCTRCLEVCPTDAFPEPGVLDARQCISYLTIELRGPIPLDLRTGVGEWLFGCDLCQDVCPWNRKAPQTSDPTFAPAPPLRPADAAAILEASDEDLKLRFRDSPLERTGPVGLKRNAAIVLGNTGTAAVVPLLARTLTHADPIVRGACAWALGCFEDPAAAAALKQRRIVEDNPDVIAELDQAIARSVP